VSDKFRSRSNVGNLQNWWADPFKQIHYHGPRRLVEESEEVSVHGVKQAFGKKALILAIRQARPLRLPVLGGHFEIWPVDESHRLPGKPERWSSLEDGNCRFWLICPVCRKKVGKLFYFYLGPDSLALSDIRCRRCHGLVYQAQNCGGNRWYREIARPLKTLLNEKRKLLTRTNPARGEARLAQIESEIRLLRNKVAPKAQRRREGLPSRMRSRQRRRYRNLDLLDQGAVVSKYLEGGSTHSVEVPNATKKD
jgi:hypothetical protein